MTGSGLNSAYATCLKNIRFKRPASKLKAARQKLPRVFKLLFPSYRKIPDLLESQDPWFAFSDDRCAHALLKRQHHRPRYRGTQFHGTVIGQGNELFRVESHFTRSRLGPGPVSQA